MKYWMYYLIAIIVCFHPHFAQKIGMLSDYLSQPGYEFWTTFSTWDFFDLLLHAGLPILLVLIGIKKQKAIKNV
jgi:hypothetical protein